VTLSSFAPSVISRTRPTRGFGSASWGLLTQMPPATDPFRSLAFETSLLALAHAEREEAVQRAFAPALFRHAPSARYAALRVAEERMQPGGEDYPSWDDTEDRDQL
jgi:hypothetical protein